MLEKSSRGVRDLRHVSIESLITVLRPFQCLSHSLSVALVGACLQLGHDN